MLGKQRGLPYRILALGGGVGLQVEICFENRKFRVFWRLGEALASRSLKRVPYFGPHLIGI